MSEELKPCPLDAGPAEMDAGQEYLSLSGKPGTRVTIYCTTCGLDFGLCKEDHPDCIVEDLIHIVTEGWNTRPQPPEQRGWADRETVARIIENVVCIPELGEGCYETHRALDAADAILALKPPPAAGVEGGYGSARQQRNAFAFLADLVQRARAFERANGEFALMDIGADVLRWAAPPSPDTASGWRAIEEAPRGGTKIVVLTHGGRALVAYMGEQVEREDGSECWTWAAAEEGQHPPCWTDGLVWASNEDGVPSDPPALWMPLPAAPPNTGEGL